jgi:ADP-glucose pyrophosphorylase
MGIYVFSRQVLLDVLEQSASTRQEIIRRAGALQRQRVPAPRLLKADVGTIGAYYDANLMLTRPDRRSASTTRSGPSSRTRASCRPRVSRSA